MSAATTDKPTQIARVLTISRGALPRRSLVAQRAGVLAPFAAQRLATARRSSAELTDDAAKTMPKKFDAPKLPSVSKDDVQFCEAIDVRKGNLVLLQGKVCKVAKFQTSTSGKHGGAKIHFFGFDVFSGKKVEELQLARPGDAT